MDQDLQFDQVKNKLASFARTSEAKERIVNIKPLTNIKAVESLLTQTEEAVKLLNLREHIPFAGSENIEHLLKKVEKGISLDATELETIADFLRVNLLIKRYFYKRKMLAPNLALIASDLVELTKLENEIYSKIEHGIVSDNAGYDLGRLRRKKCELKEKVKNYLSDFLKNKNYEQYLQDYIPFKKEGHWTIAVKASFKSKIAGQVISKSANGKTFYIEPAKVSNLVSQILAIEAQITLIEEQILGLLTARIFEDLQALRTNLAIINEIDFILARGQFSIDFSAKRPQLNEKQELVLHEVRHPLIQHPVPLSLSLTNQTRGLMITGPNAGGKTVSLKTVGLSILMTEIGLFLPSSKPCNIPIVKDIFISIGDHQNLDNSLSTFSAEMTTLSNILQKAGKRSVILLDEIGSGTDPNEGAAIAIASLSELINSGSIVIATTHYSAIKDYANKQANFITASMDFDLTTLQPTYRLKMNEVGDSRALWIAEKVGINKKVITEAKKILQTGKYPLKASKIIFHEKTKSKYHNASLAKGDIVYLSNLKKEGIFYQKIQFKDEIEVFVDKEFVTVPLKRVKLLRQAKDLYPEGYNLDLLFIKDYQDYKFNRDLNRGSKKAFKTLNKQRVIGIESGK